jgi:hypothetical protein
MSKAVNFPIATLNFQLSGINLLDTRATSMKRRCEKNKNNLLRVSCCSLDKRQLRLLDGASAAAPAATEALEVPGAVTGATSISAQEIRIQGVGLIPIQKGER